MTAMRSLGVDTRRRTASQVLASAWYQLTSSNRFEDQTDSQWSLSLDISEIVVSRGAAPKGTGKSYETFGLRLRGRRNFDNTGEMSRIDLLDASTAPLTAQSYFAGGDPGPIVAALANVPEMVGPTLGFVGAALGAGAVGVRWKEFAILRTSALQGCNYCVHAHTAVSLDVGLTTLEVRGLRGEESLENAFPAPADRAMLTWIDALAGATGPVSDDVWTTAREHHGEHRLAEVAITVGATMFLNRFATAFQLPSSESTIARLAAEGMA